MHISKTTVNAICISFLSVQKKKNEPLQSVYWPLLEAAQCYCNIYWKLTTGEEKGRALGGSPFLGGGSIPRSSRRSSASSLQLVGIRGAPPSLPWEWDGATAPPAQWRVGRKGRGAGIVPWERLVLQLLCGSHQQVSGCSCHTGDTWAHRESGKGRAAGRWIPLPLSKCVLVLGVVLSSGF